MNPNKTKESGTERSISHTCCQSTFVVHKVLCGLSLPEVVDTFTSERSSRKLRDVRTVLTHAKQRLVSGQTGIGIDTTLWSRIHKTIPFTRTGMTQLEVNHVYGI